MPGVISSLATWASSIIPTKALSREELASLSVELACANVANEGGGPFACVIADDQGLVIGVGLNSVVQLADSTAHAEIQCLRYTQNRLQTHDLSGKGLAMFASCSPCIQCFGAIYWSGLSQISYVTSTSVAETLGFDEGPISNQLWALAKAKKNISLSQINLPASQALAPFELYKKKGLVIY